MAELISETPTKHRIVFTAPSAFKAKLTQVYEKDKLDGNLMIIDNYINDFNTKTGNLISDNNYSIVDDKNFEVAILFKHLFRAIGTTRKYAKFKVSITSDTSVLVQMDTSLKLKLKTPSATDLLPVKYIKVSYVETGDIITVTIEFETEDDIGTYKCFPMIMVMITDMFAEAGKQGTDGSLQPSLQ